MKLLLDTCTFLWIASNDPQLSPRARALFSDPAHEVLLSSVSAWEIAVKHRLGRLPLPQPVERFIPRIRQAHHVQSLPLDEEAALSEARLPPLHRDPFDRMLIAQALAGGLVLLTPDEQIMRYPVRTDW